MSATLTGLNCGAVSGPVSDPPAARERAQCLGPVGQWGACPSEQAFCPGFSGGPRTGGRQPPAPPRSPHLGRTSHRPTHPGTNCPLSTNCRLRDGGPGRPPQRARRCLEHHRRPPTQTTLRLPEHVLQGTWSCWPGVLAALRASGSSSTTPTTEGPGWLSGLSEK